MSNKANIDRNNLLEVLSMYNINEQISDFSFYINWYDNTYLR